MEKLACGAAAGWVIRFIFVGNQPFSVNGEAMELPASGCRNMNPEAAKSFGDVAMENARNLGTFDYFPKSQTGSPWRRACRMAAGSQLFCSPQWNWLLPMDCQLGERFDFFKFPTTKCG